MELDSTNPTADIS